MKAVERQLALGRDAELTPRSTLADGAKGWLAMFEAQVARAAGRRRRWMRTGTRSRSRWSPAWAAAARRGDDGSARPVPPGDVEREGVRDGEGDPDRSVGICGWLVRQDGLPTNPVRDVTPLEMDRDRTARALTPKEIREWLAVLDADEYAQRKDLPELARFLLATGLRLGEALGIRWTDIDMDRGVMSVERTVLRIKGRGCGRRG